LTATNRLKDEKSPYLLQHASNPVDWFPWGGEAFDRARKEDKPIFLSVGYSTCHWCHVMAHESFEDAGVARLLNENFVCVKVDREERPDIDAIYMAACQMMTGKGGWPLTVVMMPDGRPFFAGTYFPKEDRFGQIGMLELLPQIADVWKTRRNDALAAAENVTNALQGISRHEPGEIPDKYSLKLAFANIANIYDAANGGFGDAPKFPTPQKIMFLLRYWKRTNDPAALEMAENTLNAMRNGGIHDQLGGGFHRYSTDAQWLVPHFEKMLYDQAMMVLAYVEAFQATRKKEYAETAKSTIAYVLRDLTAPSGGFLCAEDADSEGKEGKFYVWTADEIRSALGGEDSEVAIRTFNVSPEGNFVEPMKGGPKGENILHFKGTCAELAGGRDAERLDSIRMKLFKHREKRQRPHRDDKVLTDWNGLMIAAIARAAQVLDIPEYADAASRAASFILENLLDNRGRLLHRFRDGEAAVTANADDYAFLIWGLMELYETDFDAGHLRDALRLNDEFLQHFWDDKNGGFHFTADDQEGLIARTRDIHDSAIPSANAVAMLNLLKLARIAGNSGLDDKADRAMRAFSSLMRESPLSCVHAMLAVDFAVGPAAEVVISGKPGSADTAAMLRALRGVFHPNKVVLLRPAGKAAAAVDDLAPYLKDYPVTKGKSTAYVCRGSVCGMPVSEPARMLALLDGGKG
jgi:uncharacterized protein YyaL (SSP411 family)